MTRNNRWILKSIAMQKAFLSVNHAIKIKMKATNWVVVIPIVKNVFGSLINTMTKNVLNVFRKRRRRR